MEAPHAEPDTTGAMWACLKINFSCFHFLKTNSISMYFRFYLSCVWYIS